MLSIFKMHDPLLLLFLFGKQDELEAELEDLEEEELEDELPEPPKGIPVAPSVSAAKSSRPAASDFAELTKLQAEMAL
jgi:charged multivesicular body protein 4